MHYIIWLLVLYQSIAWLGTVDSDGGKGDTNLATCSQTAW